MKSRYSFVQIVLVGPQRSVPLPVKHDYVDSVGLTLAERQTNYLNQNPGRGLTRRQLRQMSRKLRTGSVIRSFAAS